MNIATYKELLMKALHKYSYDYDGDYYYVGIRYEDKMRAVGDVCECSKHNAGEREFPNYCTEEYEELDELNGTSAWHLEGYLESLDLAGSQTDLIESRFGHVKHAYIVVGSYTDTPIDADDGEIVIEDATVVKVIF